MILKEGQKIVDEDAIILEEGQKVVDFNAIVLEEGQIAVPENNQIVDEIPLIQDVTTDRYTTGQGSDSPGNSFVDSQLVGPGIGKELVAMTLGEGPGQSDSNGDGQNNSTASGEGDGDSALAQEVNEFIQGEGEGGFDAEKSRGQGAEGQGQGAGGEAALGEDQSPKTQRKRGLMLQPLMAEENKDETTKTSSTLLRNLSEGSMMGNNLLDALALGAGVLYAL